MLKLESTLWRFYANIRDFLYQKIHDDAPGNKHPVID
jgi:hypothetical protein